MSFAKGTTFLTSNSTSPPCWSLTRSRMRGGATAGSACDVAFGGAAAADGRAGGGAGDGPVA
eukprot:686706-Alexandrium_andersonii.AAC.1